ncbi:PREDICTED: uncharacterized protein LOC109486264 [Branchiostoma belcheri]|uniref:Uncharacterized protein LOC109486264 n=1 Tax=Branchiostoma belcheri TaxID=7741 RepID=A0A6P4ZWM5_BRABE|nr:PREDICTED: uncharacterized protein LOC109486264 [Branchiostoma belcheri]
MKHFTEALRHISGKPADWLSANPGGNNNSGTDLAVTSNSFISSMMLNDNVVIVVFAILVSCASIDLTCFPGCTSTKSWSSCLPDHSKPSHIHPSRKIGACILCRAHLQEQPVLNNTYHPNSTCLPNSNRVGIQGFSFGVLSVEKLRPPQQSKVHDLALIECGITDLEQGLLAEFPDLQWLYLDYNNLTHVKQNWFDAEQFKTPRLYYLSLSHNYISNIDSKCFEKLPFLHTLILDSNRLQSVQPSWFHKLKLDKLSLKSNSIKSVALQTFKSMSRNLNLDLSMNELTCLSRETVEGIPKLRKLSLGGNMLLAVHNLVMRWQIVYQYYRFSGQRIAVMVNETLFCITAVPLLKQFYQVQMECNPQTHAAWPSIDSRCTFLTTSRLTRSQKKYSFPLILISVNNSESDKYAKNTAHLCQHAWENVSTVKVALRGDTTLQIVPIGVEKSYNPQSFAIVLSDVIMSKENTTASPLEEMTNITCLVYTWDKTYQHVFTAPLSSTPDDPVCVEKATRNPGSTFNGTREGIALTTRESNITTTKVTLNQTSRLTTVCTCSPCPNGTVTKERSPHVAIVIMGTVIGVVLVELLVAYVIRRQRCCSRGHLAGVRGTAPNRCQQSSGDDQQYSEIPDEYYNQQNTVQSTTPRTDHHKYYNYHRNSRPGAQNPYWEIPDEYYSRYHTYTYPPTRRVPDKSYSVTINAAAAEVVLPSSTRRGGKHPSYDIAPQVWRDSQNHQIPVRGRQTNIRSHRIVAPSSNPRYMNLIGKYCKTLRTAKFRKQRMPLYNNPFTQPDRHQKSSKYEAALRAEPSKNQSHPNISCQQASKGVINISQGLTLARCERDSKGQVHRSKTLDMSVSHLMKSTKKASHHRQSI